MISPRSTYRELTHTNVRSLLAVSPTSVGTLEDGPGRDCLNVTFLFLPDGLPHTVYVFVSLYPHPNKYVYTRIYFLGRFSFILGSHKTLTFGTVLFKSQLIAILMVRFRVSLLTMVPLYLGVTELQTAELKGAVF